jgi:hypothetical protein
MKVGDLVSFVMPTGYRGSARRGILVKRTRLAYDPKYCRWDVFYKGGIENARQSNLRTVSGNV